MSDITIYTDIRLAFHTDSGGNIDLTVHPLRRGSQLDFPHMEHKLSPEEKEQFLVADDLDKTIEITSKSGELFATYVSISPQTNGLIAPRADRMNTPKEIKGVTLSGT